MLKNSPIEEAARKNNNELSQTCCLITEVATLTSLIEHNSVNLLKFALKKAIDVTQKKLEVSDSKLDEVLSMARLLLSNEQM